VDIILRESFCAQVSKDVSDLVIQINHLGRDLADAGSASLARMFAHDIVHQDLEDDCSTDIMKT
jgi:hypothetical protein